MAQFQPALVFGLNFEDPRRQYANVPDEGGFAISGINSIAFPADYNAILALPAASRPWAVGQFYQANFWLPMKLGGIDSQDVANRGFDEGVNTGKREGVVCLQAAVNVLTPGALSEDGVIGPNTLDALNAADPDAILAAIRRVRGDYYRAIALRKPADAVYLTEWLARAEA